MAASSTLLAIAMALALPGAPRTSPADVAAGQRIAEENCGMCHATGKGPSPLPGAPPFRDLYHRYPAGGLAQLLQEGMIAPTSPPEEGRPQQHPRMPQVLLDDDQVAELPAYLSSLDPHAKRP